MSVDEAAIREVLFGRPPFGQPLLPQGITAVVDVEGDWASIALTGGSVPPILPRTIHRALTDAVAAGTFEVRAGDRIYRGGVGFGEGRHVVAVLGGKGGVGKSTVAANLAVTLAAMGACAGLLDADVNAPDVPHMLGVPVVAGREGVDWQLWSARVVPPSARAAPRRRFGVEVASIGFDLGESSALAVTGRVLVSALLRHLLFDTAWTSDVVLIDAPPGTGDELHAMVRDLPLSGALFVTTPQDLAQMDAGRTLTLLHEHGVPTIGVVHNMAALTCPHCHGQIDLFAPSTRLSDIGVPVVGRLPFDVRLSAAADGGRPLVLADPRGPLAHEFARIAAMLRHWLAERDEAAR